MKNNNNNDSYNIKIIMKKNNNNYLYNIKIKNVIIIIYFI